MAPGGGRAAHRTAPGGDRPARGTAPDGTRVCFPPTKVPLAAPTGETSPEMYTTDARPLGHRGDWCIKNLLAKQRLWGNDCTELDRHGSGFNSRSKQQIPPLMGHRGDIGQLLGASCFLLPTTIVAGRKQPAGQTQRHVRRKHAGDGQRAGGAEADTTDVCTGAFCRFLALH
ncbi:hypothetical protein Bbelb_120140 [Branchiostoma belcheri]|nr:hypothetical protein Bbelb_120140 [Branchiostoma belcheri]